MKITVIGANSFIARNLIYSIRKKYGYDVNLNLYDMQEHHLDGEGKYLQIDLLKSDCLRCVDMASDIIYMFTGKTGTLQGFEDYLNYTNINEIALLNVLNEYRKQNASAKIVFPSSRLVYRGRTEKLTEDACKEFKTVYSMNKFACENYLEMFNRVYGIKYLIFRICVPYGTLVPNASSYGTAEFMIRNAQTGKDITLYGGGTVRRTFTHIADLCNVLIEGGSSDKCENDVFNVGGEDFSLREIAESIAEKYGVKAISVPWPDIALKIESGDTVFDSSKLDSLIEFRYSHTFNEWINQLDNKK